MRIYTTAPRSTDRTVAGRKARRGRLAFRTPQPPIRSAKPRIRARKRHDALVGPQKDHQGRQRPKKPTGEKKWGKTAMPRLGPVFGSLETNRSQTNTPRGPARPPGKPANFRQKMSMSIR